jgi:hypothetical protein
MQSLVADAGAQEMLEPSGLWRCGGSKLPLGQIACKGVLELRAWLGARSVHPSKAKDEDAAL